MGESSSDFRDTLLELIATSPEPMDHPSPDQWIAYHRGELPDGEEASLQEHLARCRDCFDLSEAAAAFALPDDPPARNVREISAGPRSRPARWSRLPTTLAASFFVALVGLTAWNLSLRSALRAPRPNTPIFDFSAGERDPGQQEVTLPAGPRMLVFHPAEELPAYRLAIRDATGREVSADELRLDKDLAALTLYLPEGLRPGRYRVELADGSGKTLETHILRVTEAGGGG